MSAATAGVILRALSVRRSRALSSSASPTSTPRICCGRADGRGSFRCSSSALQDRPALFSTFLMWLLADLFHDLPEVGDVDKPKLVFFFDEAHLLFNDASKPSSTRSRRPCG